MIQNLYCNENATTFSDCRHDGWGVYSEIQCGDHGQDAGVECNQLEEKLDSNLKCNTYNY